IVFMFYKNLAYAPTAGGAIGFSQSPSDPSKNGGYGVELDTWYNGDNNDPSASYIGLVKDSVANHLASANVPGLENGAWHTINIDVFPSKMVVYHDGSPVLVV